jgi:hypothetical protein
MSRPVMGLLYLYVSWSLALREEYRLRVFKSWVLRGTKGDKV